MEIGCLVKMDKGQNFDTNKFYGKNGTKTQNNEEME